MSSGMPELGSKISLISKADIRYEGRLFTVDPQECTIALASVRSFGTEDRETQYPVAPQNQVYDYILFRGSDIKDIRVVNNASSLPNDPAIVQLSAPSAGGQFQAQFHPLGALGPPHAHYAPYRPPAPAPPAAAAPARPPRAPSGFVLGSVLELIGANAAPSGGSRSATPGARKSPAAERSAQAEERPPRRQRDERPHDDRPRDERPRDERPRDDRPRDERQRDERPHDDHYQRQRQRPDNRNYLNHGNYGQNNHIHNQNQNHHYPQQQMHQQPYQYFRGGRGMGRRGRGAGGRPGQPLPLGAADGPQRPARPKNALKFEDDYDFEQANTRFEELRTQLAKVKLEEPASAPAAAPALDDPGADGPRRMQATEAEKKDDSGNETGAGEAEAEEGEVEAEAEEAEGEGAYDKAKSFFDNISCEAVERSLGRSQRRDWRAERKLNSETFGVASARRAPWRGARGGWRGWSGRGQGYQPQHRRGQARHQQHHSQQHQQHQPHPAHQAHQAHQAHRPMPQAQQGN